MPELTKTQASNLAHNIREQSIAVSGTTDGWTNYFDDLNQNDKGYIVDLIKNTKDLSKLTGEDLVKANQKARASALSYNEAIKAQTLSAKAKSAALKGLAMIGNMFVAWAVIKSIEAVTKGIDNFVHSAEHCKERVNEMITTFSSSMDTANAHKKTVNEIAGRYEELSKGVNNLGETTGLTAKETQEYHDICNQIAEMFPAMVQGYTSEGDAILKLKGNVDALKESYEAEEQAAYTALIASGKDSDGNDIIADWKYSLSEDKGKGTNITQAIEELEAFITSDIDAAVYTALREKASAGIYDGRHNRFITT